MNDEKFDPMQAVDSIRDLAETYGGMRNSLIQQGFTSKQAGDIVVAVLQQVAAESWKALQ